MTTPNFRLITTSNKSDLADYRPLSVTMRLPSGRYIAAGSKVTTYSTVSNLPSVYQKAYYQTPKFKQGLRLITQKSKQVVA